ncbi:MAG: endonuclease/exonuclease/phosphatase family protein [Saprospiraceae bacterium]
MKPFLKNTLRWLNVLLILVTLLAYLSPFINPSKVWHFSFLGLAYPILLFGNVLFIAFWLWRRNRYFLFSAGCILAGFGYFSSLLGLHFFSEKDSSKDAISVMTYNVAGLSRYFDKKNSTSEKKLEAFKTLLKKTGTPDVFCVQESALNLVRETLQEITGYPYFFKEKGTVIFSKYPFADSGKIPFGKTSNSCIWGDLKTPKGIVRVYAAHLQSNWLAPAAMEVVEDVDPRKKKTWLGIAKVLRLYKSAASRRSEQVGLVASHIAQSPHPVILCGDLNDTPVSYVYQVLSKDLQDSFCEKGFGFDFTYAGKIPGLRIDYIFSDQSFKVLSHEVPKLELSDHYPVLVSLERE